MCGIAGFYAFEKKDNLAYAALVRMVDAMHHRGPDHQGAVVRGQVGLGTSRLAIIDPAGSNQPITNEKKDVWLIFNGEIYNFVELREELAEHGHTFTTQGDGEAVVHGYEEWGVSVLERLNGMFAIAIWDERRRKLILARDRLGIKPLYFYRDQRRVIFASEVKAILASSKVSAEIRKELLDCYLTFRYVPAPDTIFEKIEKLMPGEYCIYDREGTRNGTFHQLRFLPKEPMDEIETKERLGELFRRSIEFRLRSDAPIGVFLSGGLDSSFIVAMVREFTDRQLHSYSIGFNRGGKYNELDAARVVSKRFGTTPNELEMDHTDFIKGLPMAVYYLEEPMADPSSVPMRELALIARQKVKVVLSGEGGDELFAGYRRYLGEMGASKFTFPEQLAALAAAVLRPFLSRSSLRGVKGLGIKDPVRRHLFWQTIVSDKLRAGLLAANDGSGGNACYQGASPLEIVRAVLKGCDSADARDKLHMADMRLWLVEDLLLKKDKMGMSASIEARVPFLDHELVGYACRLRPEMKVRRSRGKYIFRKLIDDFLPDEILSRPKVGFAVPLADWFRNELKNLLGHTLTGKRGFLRTCLNRDAVRDCLEAHYKGQDLSLELYSLLVLELWGRIFLLGNSPEALSEELARY